MGWFTGCYKSEDKAAPFVATRVLKSSARADQSFQWITSAFWFGIYSAIEDFVDRELLLQSWNAFM